MKRRRWERRLLVALLVMGVCSALAGPPAYPARAMAALSGRGAGPRLLPPNDRGVRLPSAPALLSTGPITWTQQAELTSTAQTDNDAYASAVAVSGDTAIVGAPGAPSADEYGAAYLFARSGSTWTQQMELSDPGGVPFDRFGYAVALSGDTAVIGAPGATGLSADTGAAYVYVRTGGAWSLQATLIAADGAYIDGFGQAVAISGTTILVGAPGKNNGAGAAYLFVRSGSAWTQQAELSYPGHVFNAGFGQAVALSADTAVIAATESPDAYIYVRSGGAWSLQATLADPGPAYGRYYGVAVAVAGDTALVSICCDAPHVNGAVYVFGRTGRTWTLQTALTPPTGMTESSFGTAVGLSGATAVVGGGGAFVFVGRGSAWGEQAQLIAADRPAYAIGAKVAVWNNIALIGATGAPAAAYVFVRHRVGDPTPADDTDTAAVRLAPLGRGR